MDEQHNNITTTNRRHHQNSITLNCTIRSTTCIYDAQKGFPNTSSSISCRLPQQNIAHLHQHHHWQQVTYSKEHCLGGSGGAQPPWHLLVLLLILTHFHLPPPCTNQDMADNISETEDLLSSLILEKVENLPIRRLKQILVSNGIDVSRFLEKEELVERVKAEVRKYRDSRDNGVQQQVQGEEMCNERSDNGDFADSIKYLKITPELKEALNALPLNGNTYMVGVHSKNHDDGAEFRCHVGLVEKEHGSNGKHWNPADPGVVKGASRLADGLSLVVAVSGEDVPEEDNHMLRCEDMIIGTIAKACKAPGQLMGRHLQQSFGGMNPFPIPPSRPKRILLASEGLASALQQRIKDLGIPEVAVADKKLSASMTSSFCEGAENESGSRDYYVSERRVPLKGWRPPPDVSSIPRKWYARPPHDVSNFRISMLLGWRTNMQLAMQRNDADKIKELCRRYPPEQVKEFVEMRMILTKAADQGLAKACSALIKYANASVDGVRSEENKREWVHCQSDTYNNNTQEGATPLICAAMNGHEAVVRLLIRHGAALHFMPRYFGPALHMAVARGHSNIVKELVFAGANVNQRDNQGMTAIDLNEQFLAWSMQTDPSTALPYKTHQKLLANPDRIRCCATCNAAQPQMSCPCRLEMYCDKDCQVKRWKHHKHEHKQEMEVWGI